MHSWICSHRWMRLSDSVYFYLALTRSELLRVVVEVESPSICILVLLAWLASAHCCVYFYKVCDPTSWASGKFLRFPFCSWGFPIDCFVFGVFKGGSKVVSKIDGAFQVNCIEGSIQYCWRSLILSPGCQFQPIALVLWRSFSIILGPLVPFWKGLRSFKRDYFVMASNVLGSLLPVLWSCCPFMKKVLKGDLNLSPMGFIFVSVFLLYCLRMR